MFFYEKTRLEPSFSPLSCGLKTRRDRVKRLLDTAKPAVVDGVLILLHQSHRDKLIGDQYRAEVQK